ncbi:hypothetical protein ACI65C_004456 [Semiaphis heraclei]
MAKNDTEPMEFSATIGHVRSQPTRNVARRSRASCSGVIFVRRGRHRQPLRYGITSTDDCINSVIEILTKCVEQNIIEINVEELKNKGVEITVSIPERNVIFSTSESVQSTNVQNVKDSQCCQTINWDNISSHSENEDEVNKPNKITYAANATASNVECSDETSPKNQGDRETTHQGIFTEGAARMDDEYENEWKQITNKDDSIIPEVMQSTKVVDINKKDYTEPKPKKIKTDNTQTMLLTFLEEKEEAKERRHQEKMQLIRSLLNK